MHGCFGGFFRGKRVLVTGHTGFKGGWLSEWLQLLGAEVSGLSQSVPTKPSLFEITGLAKRLRHIEADIRAPEAVEKAFKAVAPEIVFHLAAQPIVSESYRDPSTTFHTNALGTLNILEAVRKTPSIRSAVFITSDKCYENVEWEFGYRESDHLGGKDPYSASKACAELIVSSYFRSFFRSQDCPTRMASARAGNVIGGGDWAQDRIVPDCFRAWSESKDVTLRNPAATRPWQHVLEPLSGYLLLAQRLCDHDVTRFNGEAFNFGPPADVDYPVENLVARLSALWGGGRFNVVPSNMPEAGLLKLCCDKAQRRLKWRPTLGYDQTVSFTGEWYRAFYRETADPLELTRAQIRRYVELARATGIAWAGSDADQERH